MAKYVATEPIFLHPARVRAYNEGDDVPESVVKRHKLHAQVKDVEHAPEPKAKK